MVNMKLIKQTLFKIELYKPGTQWNDIFFVEADDLETALVIAKETIKEHYKEWQVHSITAYAPCYKSTTKTVTIDL